MKKIKRVLLFNPWSKAPTKSWSWKDIEAFANYNLGSLDRADWLNEALEYFNKDDGWELGSMIIGS